jgi:hypothetical protein
VRALLTDNTSSAALVSTWVSNTAVLVLTRLRPTAKPNASSRPLCANGPTPLTGKIPTSETVLSLPGPTTTTASDLMVASTISRPSAALNQVQRLDHLQPPSAALWGLASWPASYAAIRR